MRRVIYKINEILEKRGSIGYIKIYYNGEEIGHFATKEKLKKEGIETTNGMIFLKKNYIESIAETVKKITTTTKIIIDGDYYGDGFTGWLIEGINFCEE